MKNTKQRNLVTDQNQNWTKRTTFKSWEQKLRHETEIEVTRQKLTHLIIPLFNFYSDPAWGRDTITGNWARPREVTEVPLSLSLAKNHFWLVATQKKRSVLIIQILFSCSIADLISDFQRQLNSFTFVNIGFDLLISVLNSKFSSAGSISVLIRRNGNCSFYKTEFEREYQPWSPLILHWCLCGSLQRREAIFSFDDSYRNVSLTASV